MNIYFYLMIVFILDGKKMRIYFYNLKVRVKEL